LEADMKRTVLPVVALLLLGSCCPARENCLIRIQRTLRDEAEVAAFVVHVRLEKPHGDAEDGGTSMVILSVIKDHPFLKDVKELRLQGRVPIANVGKPQEMLVFAELIMGQPNYYRLMDGGPELARYVSGLCRAGSKGRDCLLAHCGSYLGHADKEIAADVYRELLEARPIELAQAAQNYDPTVLRRLLSDKETPGTIASFYGFLLGLCGEASDAAVLRECLERCEKTGSQSVDGFLTGIVLLAPKDGWPLLRAKLGNASTDCRLRLSAVRAARTMMELSPKTSRKQAIAAVALGLDQADMVDMAIEHLRLWHAWEKTDRVLKAHDLTGKVPTEPVVRRAVLRFALQSPMSDAKAYVDRIRKENPQEVADVEEQLWREAPSEKSGDR
jgi:hypothetical protein